MATMNQTSLYFSIAPTSEATQTNNQGGHTYNVYGEGSNTVLRSVNDSVVLQVFWDYSTSGLTQAQEGTGAGGERDEGDLVNVLFDIYEGTTGGEDNPGGTLADDFTKICTIKKPKDSPMKWNGRPFDKVPLEGHRFTINISEILADLLSYSLVPVGIGTWGCIDDGTTGPQVQSGSQSTYVSQFGGMNGQWVDSNVASTTNDQERYNLSANGSDRRIRVEARFELLANDGSLELSTNPASRSFSDFYICNAAPQWGDRHDLKNREISSAIATTDGPYFLTNSPNTTAQTPGSTADTDKQYYKPIRLDDNAEYLQWFQKVLPTPPGAHHIDGFGIFVEYSANADMSSSSFVYLTDCTGRGRALLDGGSDVNENQYRQFVQNVSPAYINQHNNGTQPDMNKWSYTATPLAIGTYYRCTVYNIDSAANENILSAYQYYKVVEETKGGWSDVCGMKEGVKFMWLNRMGGIDSYLAKRIFSKSIDIQRETIIKKSPDRLHSQNTGITGIPWNNNIGANMYPHSREVLNVDANRKFSAMTDPLTVPEANWLEELLTSPNVWVIQENDGSKYLEGRTPTEESRPSTQGYMPIVITSSDVALIDEAQGLSQINIEFVESHAINTQRN